MMFRYPFDSPEARKLNREIFEALYYGCLRASNELAIEREFDMRELQGLLKEDISRLPEYYDKNIEVSSEKVNTLYQKPEPVPVRTSGRQRMPTATLS